MNKTSTASTAGLNRRHFIGSSALAAGGLVIGFHVADTANAQGTVAASPEVNAWVVINTDDSVVIRIARSETKRCSPRSTRRTRSTTALW